MLVQVDVPDDHLPAPEARVRCVRLHATLSARACLLRQHLARSRTRDTWRGQGARFPSCRGCAQGAHVAALLELPTPGRRTKIGA